MSFRDSASALLQDIYKDTHGGLQSWASAWKTFASTFKDEPGIVGYELMNEPWAGDVWKDPLLWDPGTPQPATLWIVELCCFPAQSCGDV